jgi:uncharacterized protein with HEPN domain
MNHLQQLERKARLWHVARAAETIQTFIAGRSAQEYEQDAVLASAIERQLITIGEALHRAKQADPELVNQLTDVNGIIGLRNQLVHNYPNVDATRIWRIIEDDLPVLLREVRALLGPPPA